MSKSGDHQQESTLIGVSDICESLLALDGFRLKVERIIVDNLFGFVRRDLMERNVTTIGIVPLKRKIMIQAIL